MGRRSLPFGHGSPTPLMREAWETVERLGTQIAACAALGVEQGTLAGRLDGYMFAMGIEGRRPGAREYVPQRPRGAGLIGTLRHRITELEAALAAAEAEVERLRTENEALSDQAHPWIAVHAKLDLLISRPAGGAFQPDHRRVADGGRTVKEQRRALRPTG